MSWRSVIISQPARLSYQKRALHICQDDGQTKREAKVPLEDISVIIIEHMQVVLTAQLLSACADAQIAVFTTNAAHLPNGALLPYLPHSRLVKVMRAQLDLSLPTKKRLWQIIIQQKILNQSAVLSSQGHAVPVQRLKNIAAQVRSGDSGNAEGRAAQIYFSALFGQTFTRDQPRFCNAALNYGYAIVRGAIARTLCAYGFLPALGLFHHNEQNAFNLADDLIEPYRPVIDKHILKYFPHEVFNTSGDIEQAMTPQVKALLVGVLNEDVLLNRHTTADASCTMLAAIQANVISFSQAVFNKEKNSHLVMPMIKKIECKRDSVTSFIYEEHHIMPMPS